MLRLASVTPSTLVQVSHVKIPTLVLKYMGIPVLVLKLKSKGKFEEEEGLRRVGTWVTICLPQCLRSTVHRRKSDPMQEGRDCSSGFCWKYYTQILSTQILVARKIKERI